jgi:predicted Zn-dependent protease
LLTEPVIDRHLLKPQIQDRLYTTALHEVGHALGLEHSTQAKDVMHHQGWRNKHLTPNDVSRLSTLYKRSSSTISWL